MGLMLLDGTTFLPSKYVEGWSSLIWTERFVGAGEFELHTPQISETMSSLTEGKLLSLDETREVMIVESRSITKDENGGPQLTVTGRTFDTILEQRAILTGETPANYSRTGATIILLYLQKSLVVGSVYNTADGIPNVAASSAGINQSLATENFKWDMAQDVASKITETLNTYNLGIRNSRPVVSGGTLGIQVYDGRDLTFDSATNKKIVLDYSAGHLKNPSYLWSIKDYKNIAYVNSPIGFKIVAAPGVSTSIAGLARRVLYVDASDLTSPGSDTVAVALTKRGTLALAQQKRQATFDGELNAIAPYVYNRDYYLGDKISAKGDYGIMQDMVVSEFIRNWSNTDGYKAYPTLVDA